jgi:hypothetical protein
MQRRPRHLQQRVRAAQRFGAAELAHVDVALAETARRVLPVLVELAVDEPAEDLQELGTADIVEHRIEVPRTVSVLVEACSASAGCVRVSRRRRADRRVPPR